MSNLGEFFLKFREFSLRFESLSSLNENISLSEVSDVNLNITFANEFIDADECFQELIQIERELK